MNETPINCDNTASHDSLATNDPKRNPSSSPAPMSVPPGSTGKISVNTKSKSPSAAFLSSPSAESPTASSVHNASPSTKCSQCNKRKSAEGCDMGACLACCTNLACLPHKRGREVAAWKLQVLAGTTPVQLLAADLRRRRIPLKQRFVREPGFVYTGDTIVIWNIREYLANPKWKEEAIRKTLRRQARDQGLPKTRRLGNSKKRFRRFLRTWLESSKNEMM
jgi:hypothetical protein